MGPHDGSAGEGRTRLKGPAHECSNTCPSAATRSFYISSSLKGGPLNLRELAVELNLPEALPSPRTGELYIGVKVPWSWIEAAGRLPGRALHVGMLLWREAGRRRTARVPMSVSAVARMFGISRASAGRALAALEAAQLVCVERRAGAKAHVRLLGAARESTTPGRGASRTMGGPQSM